MEYFQNTVTTSSLLQPNQTHRDDMALDDMEAGSSRSTSIQYAHRQIARPLDLDSSANSTTADPASSGTHLGVNNKRSQNDAYDDGRTKVRVVEQVSNMLKIVCFYFLYIYTSNDIVIVYNRERLERNSKTTLKKQPESIMRRQKNN